jgi:hypothetical protein
VSDLDERAGGLLRKPFSHLYITSDFSFQQRPAVV